MGNLRIWTSSEPWTSSEHFKTMRSVWTKSHATEPTIDTNHSRSYHVPTTIYRTPNRMPIYHGRHIESTQTMHSHPMSCDVLVHTNALCQFTTIHVNISKHAYINKVHTQTTCYSFSNNNTQNDPNLGPIKNKAPLGPFTVHHRIIGIQKHTTKPKDVSPGIKTRPQYSPGLPENLVQIVRKQSRKFN